jgi:hypothetical protein
MLKVVFPSFVNSRRDQECQTDNVRVSRTVMTDSVTFPLELFDPDYAKPIPPAEPARPPPARGSVQYGFQQPAQGRHPLFTFNFDGMNSRPPTPGRDRQWKFVFRPPERKKPGPPIENRLPDAPNRSDALAAATADENELGDVEEEEEQPVEAESE